MKVLVKSGGEKALAQWQECFRRADPRLEVHYWADPGVAPEDVHYVIVWEPEHGRLAQFPNLKVVFSSAAGVDHITCDPEWPRHLPLVRMGGEGTSQRMGEFVVLSCLTLLRDARTFALAQVAGEWRNQETLFYATDRTVGIMGLGNLGSRAAQMLQGIGFPVQGWSRSRKELPDVKSFAGAEELPAFLASTDILVCLLPSTPETEGLIDAALLAQLPKGAGLVNVGRGSHMKVEDLLAALDSGHLSGAVLDVFEPEPLAADSPLWSHPKITVTPHVASMASRPERVTYIAAAIAAHEAGQPLPNLYDHERGY